MTASFKIITILVQTPIFVGEKWNIVNRVPANQFVRRKFLDIEKFWRASDFFFNLLIKFFSYWDRMVVI